MPAERWDDERLDRLADLVSSITVQNVNQGQRIEEAIELSRSNFSLIHALGLQIQGLSEQVQAVTGQVESLTRKVDETTNVANGNARAIQAMADAIAEAAEERRENLRLISRLEQRIDEQQSFVRGLQTENNRMWEYLTGRRNEDDNPDTP
jgi:methyl-accepting chemotaxis protein